MRAKPPDKGGPPARPYNPLEKRRLAESIVRELLGLEAHPLPPGTRFPGAGIYTIYYRGDFELYRPLSGLNAREWRHPIYVGSVGSASSPGGRKGCEFSDELPRTRALFNRLAQHAETIAQAKNLDIGDFRCRYLVVDEIWVRLAESLLISNFRPLWNVVVDGFGNHDPGAGRHQGKRPSWDTLHPGRAWAERLQPGALSVEEIKRRVSAYMIALGAGSEKAEP
jgi:hypothetical protein